MSAFNTFEIPFKYSLFLFIKGSSSEYFPAAAKGSIKLKGFDAFSLLSK